MCNRTAQPQGQRCDGGALLLGRSPCRPAPLSGPPRPPALRPQRAVEPGGGGGGEPGHRGRHPPPLRLLLLHPGGYSLLGHMMAGWPAGWLQDTAATSVCLSPSPGPLLCAPAASARPRRLPGAPHPVAARDRPPVPSHPASLFSCSCASPQCHPLLPDPLLPRDHTPPQPALLPPPPSHPRRATSGRRARSSASTRWPCPPSLAGSASRWQVGTAPPCLLRGARRELTPPASRRNSARRPCMPRLRRPQGLPTCPPAAASPATLRRRRPGHRARLPPAGGV